MLKSTLITLLSVVCIHIVSRAQYPVSANLKDEKGLRTGHWTVWYDSLFHETENIDSVRYYRMARFEAGKPVGKVRDFYASRQKQWDGYLLSVNPEIKHGEATYYYENGQVLQQVVFDNDKLSGSFRSYYLNGNPTSEGTMKNDTSEGVWYYYYENGVKQAMATYHRGVIEGPVILYYPNGNLQARGMKKNGLMDGNWERYHENGQIQSRESYKNDLYDGSYESYNEAGVLISKGAYKNNNYAGVWQYYHDNGKLKAKGRNLENGDKTGEWKYYTPEGKPGSVENLVNGKLHGLKKDYYPVGTLMDIGLYKNGLRDSIWKYFHENGQLSSTGNYAGDSAEGKWTYYNEAGFKTAEGIFADNKKEGGWKFYDEQGILSKAESFKRGNYDGVYYTYYPGGQVKSKEVYQNGLNEGLYQSYHANGQIEREGTYVNGKSEGKWKNWYANGRVQLTCSYKNGVREGEWLWYYDNGQLSDSYFYKDGSFDGNYTEYFDNGNKKIEGQRKSGLKEGFNKFYTRNGNIYSQGNYENGERQGKWFFNDSLTGKKESEGVYAKGFFNGKWIFYDSLGKKRSTSHYIHGFLESVDNVVDSVERLIELYEYDKAMAGIDWLKKVIDRDKGRNHVAQAFPYNLYGSLYYDQGKYDRSLEAYRKYGEITKKYRGDTVNNYAVALNGIAINLVAMRRYDEALLTYDKALKLNENIHGRFSSAYATVLSNKANVYIHMKKPATGEEILKTELKIKEEKFGVNHKETFKNIYSLAEYYSKRNDIKESMRYYRMLSDAINEEKTANKSYYVAAKRSLAFMLHLVDRDKEALQEIRSLLSFTSEAGETNTIQFLVDFKSTAVYYNALQHPDTAKLIYEHIVRATEKNGWQNTDIATEASYGLAILFSDNYEYDKAFALYGKVIRHYENSGQTNTNLFANILHAYGYALYASDKGKAEEALKYYLKSSEIKKELNGETDTRYIESLVNLANMYIYAFRFKEAESAIAKAIDIVLRSAGKDSYYYASCKTTLASLKTSQVLPQEALQNAREAMVFYANHQDEYLSLYTGVLSFISSTYSTIGNADSSEYYIRLAVNTYKKNKNETDVDFLVLNSSLASILMGNNLYNEAEKIYLGNAVQYAATSGKDNMLYAFALRNLGYFYTYKGDNRKAKMYYTDYKEAAEKLSGKNSDYTLEALASLANINKRLENYKEAEALCMQVNNITRANYGVNHPAYANGLNKLGEIYNLQKRYNEAEKLFLQGSAVMAATYGKKSKEFADYQKEFAKVYIQLDKNKDAEEIYLNNVGIYAATTGKESWYYLNALDDLSNFYVRFGQYTEAEKIMLEEIAFAKTKTIKIVYPHKLYKYASLLKDWEKVNRADSMAQLALSIYEAELERNNIAVLNTRNLLGLIALKRLKLNEAGGHLQFCIDESKAKKEENTYTHGIYLNNMSSILMEKGQYEKSEKTLQQAGLILEQINKKGSLGDINYLDNYAILYQAWGKNELAEKYWLDVNRKLLAYIKTNFYFMSDNEKAQFWFRNKDDVEYFNTFAMQRSKQNPLILGEMYNNQLATKGILLSASNKIKKRILGSHDSTLINDYHCWISLKESLAKAYVLSEAEQKEQNLRLPVLEAEANKLEKNLNITAEDIEKENGNLQGNWKSIQKVLTPDEAAVEIVRFRHFDKHVTDSILYAALIITAETKNNPQLVVLPRGNDMENGWLKYYKNTVQLKLEDEASYDRYWAPVEALLKNKPKVYISLDGVYNSINLNTLRLDNGAYLIDNKNLKIVSNTRDILFIKSKQPERFSKPTATLFGFPKFFFGNKTPKNTNATERATDTIDRSGIAELPGTKVEIEKIETVLVASRWQSENYTGEKATEDALKAVQNPRVLHIATHGLFVDDHDKHTTRNVVLNRMKSQQNPLLKVGLLLSGSANYLQDESVFSGENGILTAYEAANLNLENTDLVILSACETGKGEIKNGEGVYGLQRAFQTAGAKAIIMSLWKVNDEATQQLMTSFYTNWMKGMEKQQAFKTAQMEIKKQYNSPYYWGAFVLVGN